VLLVVYSAPRCPDGRDSRRRGATTLRWPSDVGAISKFDHPLSWRMITSETPQDWRALQADVGRILSESGFTVEVEKPIETVRGEVVVDVFAEETVKGRRLATLVECKNWASRVPKQAIHAFRTVVAGSGAHVGYIVSSEGFQSGAFAAADLTNLRLKNGLSFKVTLKRPGLTLISSLRSPIAWTRCSATPSRWSPVPSEISTKPPWSAWRRCANTTGRQGG
jgi:hypothetical protein